MTTQRQGFGKELDAAVFKAAIAGRESAQRILFETYKTAVLRTLMGLCHDRELARDLAQDVFLKAFRKLHQIREPEALGGWLKQLTIHTALAEFRQRKPQAEIELEHQVDISWHAMADWLTQLDDIEQLINQLADHERMLVWLYVGEGYSHDEIAELLHEQPSTIRQRYRRALQKLYNFLTEGRNEHIARKAP